MEQILFTCDLDNTIIHSYKYKTDTDICVEWIHGKPQGFMSENTYRLLTKLEKQICLIPVTTRSVEQYQRIHWPENFRPRYAVTTNGAVLLDGKEQNLYWKTMANKFVAPYKEELERLHKLLSGQEKYIRCRMVDNSYLFVYCREDIDVSLCARENKRETFLKVIPSGRKIYFFPPDINKGMAVLQLKDMLGIQKVVSAGDSVIDIPMLNASFLALVPNEDLARQVQGQQVAVCKKEEVFSEFVLGVVMALV